MRSVARREFDVVMAWSADRVGRSLQHLLGFLGEAEDEGRGPVPAPAGLDTATPAGKALFQMMGVFAEFERDMIRERINAGLGRARAHGVRLGRPRIAPALERKAAAMLASGAGIRPTARALGIGVGTAQRIKAEATR
jgi:DNA invertase Pin-like site-specific DNA recombinase